MKAEALTLSQQGFVSEPGKQFSSKGLVCVFGMRFTEGTDDFFKQKEKNKSPDSPKPPKEEERVGEYPGKGRLI